MSNHAEAARAAAADALRAIAANPSTLPPCLVGFDGFLDSVIHVVDTRRSSLPEDYDRMSTLKAFGARASATSGASTNIELDLKEVRFGGNGPLMAGGLGQLGFPITYIGSVGQAANPAVLDPNFEPFAKRCREVISIGAPGLTDAYEFDDGRINFNKPAALRAVNAESLLKLVGRDRLIAMLRAHRVLAIVNWTLLHGTDSLLDLFVQDLIPAAGNKNLSLFVELSSSARRPDADIRAFLNRVSNAAKVLPVIFGVNRVEAIRVCEAADLDPAGIDSAEGEPIAAIAQRIRHHLGAKAVVFHVHRGSGVADASGALIWVPGRHNARPAIQTGAGDHYNAGVAAGMAMGLAPAACAALGNAVAGAYVSTGVSPKPAQALERLVEPATIA